MLVAYSDCILIFRLRKRPVLKSDAAMRANIGAVVLSTYCWKQRR